MRCAQPQLPILLELTVHRAQAVSRAEHLQHLVTTCIEAGVELATGDVVAPEETRRRDR